MLSAALLVVVSTVQAEPWIVQWVAQPELAAARAQPGDRRATQVHAALQEQSVATAHALEAVLAGQGIVLRRRFTVVNAWLVDADARQSAWLKARPEVLRLVAERSFKVSLPETEPAALGPLAGRAPEASLNLIRAPQAWALGFRGAGVVVASQDTGVQWNHPALIARYRGSAGNHAYHWHDAIHAANATCPADSAAPCDDNSHGTHTVGTMVGEDGANQVGVAPEAQWIGCRNMNATNGTPATYLECLDFMLAPTDAAGANPRPDLAPHVINNSWGCPPSEGCDAAANALLQTAVENLRAAGILFVASAGNSGPGCSTVSDAPAFFAASLTVANTTLADALATGSSRGPVTTDGSGRRKPDVGAPGTGIRSTVPTNGYGTKSGTSMAGPHVAGVAALVMSANPALKRNPEALEQILKAAVVQISNAQTCGGIAGTTWPNNQVGHGRIDALTAVQAATGGLLMRDGFESP